MKIKSFFFLLSVGALLLSSCTPKPDLNYYTFDADGLLKLDVIKPVGNTLVDLNGDSIGTLIGREDNAGKMLCFNGTDEMLVMAHMPYGASVDRWRVGKDVIFIKPHKFFYLSDQPDYVGGIPDAIKANGAARLRILMPSEVLLDKLVSDINSDFPMDIGEGLRIISLRRSEAALEYKIMLYEIKSLSILPLQRIDGDRLAADLRPDMLEFTRDWWQDESATLIRGMECPIDYFFVDYYGMDLTTIHFEPSELK